MGGRGYIPLGSVKWARTGESIKADRFIDRKQKMACRRNLGLKMALCGIEWNRAIGKDQQRAKVHKT